MGAHMILYLLNRLRKKKNIKLLQALNCFLETPLIHQIKQSRHVWFSFLYDTEIAFFGI